MATQKDLDKVAKSLKEANNNALNDRLKWLADQIKSYKGNDFMIDKLKVEQKRIKSLLK